MTVEQKVRAVFASMTGDEEFDALSNNEKWKRVQPTWREATENVLLSRKGNAIPKVEEGVKNLRTQSCFGKEKDESCPFCEWSDRGKNHYCNVCGCGGKSISKIDGEGCVTLDFPDLECPLRKPGFANELVHTSRTNIE